MKISIFIGSVSSTFLLIVPESYFAFVVPSCTDWMCLERLTFHVAWYAQVPQGYFFPRCTESMCLVRLTFTVAWYLHVPHGNFFPSCTDSMCLVSLPFSVARYSHETQGYFSLHGLLGDEFLDGLLYIYIYSQSEYKITEIMSITCI